MNNKVLDIAYKNQFSMPRVRLLTHEKLMQN